MKAFHKATLDNGAVVIVRELRHAPVVAMNLWVRSGAADDPPERAGISHFLEHMIMREDGSTEGESLTAAVQETGGHHNASTTMDHTVYYQVVPPEVWTRVLQKQIETVMCPVFRAESVRDERRVILQENSISERDPRTVVWRRVMEQAFGETPHGMPVIGAPSTLKAITEESLHARHRAGYRPAALVQTIVGDVVAADAIDRAADALGRLHDSSHLDAEDRMRASPEWSAGIRSIEGEVSQVHLGVAFRTPPVLDEGMAALDVLCGLLGQGRSSRLRKSMVSGEPLASVANARVSAFTDVGVLLIQVSTRPGRAMPAVEEIFFQTERLRRESVTAEEMDKSLRRLEGGYVLEHETAESIASTLGFFQSADSVEYVEEYMDRLAAVTARDVMEAARRSLDPEGCVMVAYGPKGDVAISEQALVEASRRGVGRAATLRLREPPNSWSGPSVFTRPAITEGDVGRATVLRDDNGARLLVWETHALPLVSVSVAFRGGFAEEEDEDVGITSLLTGLMLRGTRSRDADKLADEFEGLGSAVSSSVERDGFGFGATFVSRHLAEAMSLLGEVLSSPGMRQNDLETVRSQVLADIADSEERPFQRTMRALLPLAFPGHVYGRPVKGTEKTVRGTDMGQLAEWGTRCILADRLFVCMVGDVHPDQAGAALSRMAGPLESRSEAPLYPPEPPRPAGRFEGRQQIPGQSSVALCYAGARVGTDNSAALHVLSRALTMPGGRLWRSLRESPPYAYTVRAMPLALASGGALVCYVATPPGQEEDALATFQSVLSGVADSGLPGEDLARAKAGLAGALKVSLERGAVRSASYALAETMGVGWEHVERLPAAIERVTREDITRVTTTYLTAEDGPAVAILRG